MRRVSSYASGLVAILALVACSGDGGSDGVTEEAMRPVDEGGGRPARPTTASWPEADELFRHDPKWLGGDAAFSIALGGNRTLWLFGDSFVATGDRRDRRYAAMPRNTVAVETGLYPPTATIEFAWGGREGTPSSYFPNEGATWLWPLHGILVPGTHTVLAFMMVVKSTPGNGLGFAVDDYRLARIERTDLGPKDFVVTTVAPPKSALGALIGCGVVPDGDYLVALAPSKAAWHTGYLARMKTSDLVSGKLTPEWWNGSAWGPDTSAKPVMDTAGAECSVHFDAKTKEYVHVMSRGFGGTTIAIRTAKAMQGPWSEPKEVFTPPESKAASPFVYAGKGHPELLAPGGELVATYAANSFTYADLFTEDGQKNLYWPRFVRIAR